MRLPLALAALAFAIALPAMPAQAQGLPCDQFATDPAGDTQVPANPAVDVTPADILSVRLTWLPEGARLALELGGDPRGAGHGVLTYSYWIGFEDGADGNRPTWTFQGSQTYDRISTMYWDSPEEIPVEWNGTTFSFVVPWSAFQAHYGTAWPVDFGSPSASTSGPSRSLNNPSQDGARYGSDLVPLAPCSPPPPPAEESASEQGKAEPKPTPPEGSKATSAPAPPAKEAEQPVAARGAAPGPVAAEPAKASPAAGILLLGVLGALAAIRRASKA